jgi:cellulose synthase/poly-beta-1,6-N-acetylglucosamine synthase-like glycosyltransferase
MFVVTTLFVLFNLVPIFLLLVFPLRQNHLGKLPDKRKVVICVAARDEEQNIAKCLDGLLALDFPVNDFEIRVADDGSTDGTLEIVNKYASTFKQVSVVQVDFSDNRTKGKARALAQLTDNLSCDFIAFTDADVVVSRDWLLNMIRAIGSKGLVSGTTLIDAKSSFQTWQAMDWLLGQLQIQFLCRFFKSAPTAMGNNMLVEHSAYKKTGGYGFLLFSVTEDVSLHNAFVAEGYCPQMLFGKLFVAVTQGENSWSDLIYQRLRWANGIKNIPLIMVFFLGLQSLLFPSVLLLFLFDWKFAVLLFIIKIVLNVVVVRRENPNKDKWKLEVMVLFDVYQLVLSFGVAVRFLFSESIKWKKRSF